MNCPKCGTFRTRPDGGCTECDYEPQMLHKEINQNNTEKSKTNKRKTQKSKPQKS